MVDSTLIRGSVFDFQVSDDVAQAAIWSASGEYIVVIFGGCLISQLIRSD
jgi:hypothetical protein